MAVIRRILERILRMTSKEGKRNRKKLKHLFKNTQQTFWVQLHINEFAYLLDVACNQVCMRHDEPPIHAKRSPYH
jgi:hypothetical protein